MTLDEYFSQKINKKVCPVCGECQCHRAIWCKNDGTKFEDLDVDYRWQIKKLINFYNGKKESKRAKHYYYSIFGSSSLKRKTGLVLSEKEFLKEVFKCG